MMPVCLKTYILLIVINNVIRALLCLFSIYFYIFMSRLHGTSERDWYLEAGSGLLFLFTLVHGVYSELHLA